MGPRAPLAPKAGCEDDADEAGAAACVLAVVEALLREGVVTPDEEAAGWKTTCVGAGAGAEVTRRAGVERARALA